MGFGQFFWWLLVLDFMACYLVSGLALVLRFWWVFLAWWISSSCCVRFWVDVGLLVLIGVICIPDGIWAGAISFGCC